MTTITNNRWKLVAAIILALMAGSSTAWGQSMTVTIYGASSVCATSSSSATYTAIVTGSVGTLQYNWYVNNVTVVSNGSSTYTFNSPQNSDVVTCQVITSSGQNQYSNAITITTTQPQTFGVGSSPNQLDFCPGQTATFTANSNLPTTGVYTWEMNGIVQSATGNTFSTTVSSVAQLQAVTVSATTSSACVVSPYSTGNTAGIPFVVLPVTYPAVSLAQSAIPVVDGSPVTFTATPTGQGSSPVYQWQLNGIVVAGITGNTYTTTISSGSDLQSVSVSMTSSGTCPQKAAMTTTNFQIASSDWENMNYIREQDILVPSISSFFAVDQLSIGQKRENTTYFDGLSRKIQKVDKSGSLVGGNSSDLVIPYAYDPAGRTLQLYLPYATTDNPGHFKSANVLTEQASFVTGLFGEPSGAPTFSQTVYDNSPLNRIMQEFEPGQSWGGSGIGTSMTYDFNSSSENVQIWALAYTAGAIPTTSPSSVYATGALFRRTNTDEKGLETIFYVNYAGDTILKKVQQADSGPSLTAQQTGWASTYYVYDDLNQLRFILTPKAVDYLNNNSWGLTQQLVNDLCFVYTYDAKGRVISRKQPGIGETDIVYDQRDRAVFSQDPNGQAANQWQSTTYDLLDRVTETGMVLAAISPSTLQSYVTSNTGNMNYSSSSGTIGNLVVSGQQDGITQYVATSSIVFEGEYSSDAGGQFTALITPAGGTVVQEAVAGTDNPVPSGDAIIALTQTFYDDYSHATKTYTTSDNSLFDPSTNLQALPLPSTYDPQTRGKVITTLVKVISNFSDLTQGNWMETDQFYDAFGRTIQVQNDNYLGGNDIVTNRLDFAGWVWGSCVDHMAGSSTQFTIVSKNTFDALGRQTDLSKNFNSTYFKDLASYAYDAYGNMITKTLAPGYTGSGKSSMETQNYTYNIQGWLTGINKAYAIDQNAGDQWNNYFGLYIGYDNADNQFAAAQFDGTATGVIWKSQGDNSMRKYDYTYDNLGRLTGSNFNQRFTPADGWSNSQVDLSESVSYTDNNGNINNLQRKGIVPGTSGGIVVDNLSYTYGTSVDPNVNQLSGVYDAATFAGNGQLGDFKNGSSNTAGAINYLYDNNGNLVQDQNKGITNGSSGGVIYNYLNKPVSITIAGKAQIGYIYDATGLKLSKTVTNLAASPNTSTTTTYDDEFVYQDNVLQYVLHEEGQLGILTPVNTPQVQLNAGSNPAAVLPGKQGVFEYFVKDQLSNIRMVLTEQAQTESYIATMELSSASDPNLGTDEAKLFGQVDPTTGNPSSTNEVTLTRTATPSSLWTSNTSNYVSDLTAAGTNGNQTIGPNMLLQVTAGDMINASAAYFYYTNGTTGSSTGVSDALTALMGSLLTANVPTIAETNGSLISSALGAPTGSFSAFINGDNPSGSIQTPNAYLNILFFDEQFNFIPPDPNNPGVGSFALQVSQANTQDVNLLLQQKAPKNGWVYIYLSNESNEDVYFDNFSVSQVHSPISEENHYYAYGEKIGGLSMVSFNKPVSKYHFQADYSEEEPNTLWNEFDLRNYDPQIGRWNGVDPEDEYASPYVGMGDNPASLIDQDGGLSVPYLGLTTAIGSIVGYAIDYKNRWQGAALGAAGGLVAGILTNWALNYYSDYATPEHYDLSARRAYSDDFDRYGRTVMGDGGPYVTGYRGFDAWVNDKLADLFSDSYHFLGHVIGFKYSWIVEDEMSTAQIQEITLNLGEDKKYRYSLVTHRPEVLQEDFSWARQDRPQKIQFVITVPRGTDITISKDGHVVDNLSKAHPASRQYRVGSRTFHVKFNTDYHDEVRRYLKFSGEENQVTVRTHTKLAIKVRYRNKRPAP